MFFSFGKETKNMTHSDVLTSVNALDPETVKVLGAKETNFVLIDGRPVFKGKGLDNMKQASYQYQVYTDIKRKHLEFLYPQEIDKRCMICMQ